MAVNKSGAIEVSWIAPIVPSGELPIIGYSIHVRVANDTVRTLMTQSSPAEVIDLLPGTDYQVFVASVNALGTGVHCCRSGIFVRTHKGTLVM